MSGPIRPPLRVRDQDGNPSVIPVNTIKVTNGTLTDDGGATVSITTGSGGGGSMDDFDVAGDSGTTQTISNGETLSILGGTGLASVTTATDTLTLNIESTLVGAATPNYYDSLSINAQGQVTAIATGTAPQEALTLTTTGTSGAATLSAGTLNIPQYSGGGSGVGGSGTIGTIPVFVTDTTTIGDSRITQPNSYETLLSGTGGVTLVIQATDGNEPNLKFLNSSSLGTYFQQAADGSSLYLKQSGGSTKLWKVTTGGAVTINDAYTLPTTATGVNDYVLTAQTDGTTAWAAVSASVTFPLEGSLGSAAAPTYSYSGDTDTGIFNTGANGIGFSTGGTQRMSIDSTRLIVGSGATAGTISSSGTYDLRLETNSGTDSGVIQISDGANGAITINPDGTGTVGMGNMVFDVDQALSASEDGYVMTYTDSSGEISLREASGGGSSAVDMIWTPDITALSKNSSPAMNCYWPLYPTVQYAQPNASSIILSDQFTTCYPFYAQKTGTVASLNIYVTSAGTDQAYLAIYDTGSDGWMDSLLGICQPTGSSTGAKTATIFTENDLTTTATISLTKGNLYWLAYGGLSGDTDLPEWSSQMNGTYHVSSMPPAYSLNSGSYNPMGALRSRQAGSQGSTVPTVYPATMTAAASMSDMNWGNGSSYDLPVFVGMTM